MTWGWASKLRLDYEYHGANIRQFESTAVITYPNGSSGTIPDPVQVQHAYDVANIGIESRKGPYGLRLYVQNIGNSRPILDNTARLYDTPNVTTLRPRTIGLEVRQGL
jgi:outer membrane receptor protein involved in Fe transport